MTAELRHIKIKLYLDISDNHFQETIYYNNKKNKNRFIAVLAKGFIVERDNKIITKSIIIIN